MRAVCALIWAKRPEEPVGWLWRRTAGPDGKHFNADVDVLMAIDAIQTCVEMRPDVVVLVTWRC